MPVSSWIGLHALHHDHQTRVRDGEAAGTLERRHSRHDHGLSVSGQRGPGAPDRTRAEQGQGDASGVPHKPRRTRAEQEPLSRWEGEGGRVPPPQPMPDVDAVPCLF